MSFGEKEPITYNIELTVEISSLFRRIWDIGLIEVELRFEISCCDESEKNFADSLKYSLVYFV